MATNFYATVKVNGDEATPEFRMHLGKTSNISTDDGYMGSATIDGNMFESFASMISFLRYNKNNVTIESETGVLSTVEEFIEEFNTNKSGNKSLFDKYFADSDHSWMDDDGFIVNIGFWH